MLKRRINDNYFATLIILIIFVITTSILGDILKVKLDSSNLGFVLLPVSLLILFYILIHQRATRFEYDIWDILETHVTNVEYINDGNKVKSEFIRAVNDANKYIMTTGGKSRIKEYLIAIEKNISEKDTEYWRVIFGEKITNELHSHLLEVVGKQSTYLAYTKQELGPVILLTENVVFLGFPDPKPEEFKDCLKVVDERMIYEIGRYIRRWYRESTRLNNKGEIDKVAWSK